MRFITTCFITVALGMVSSAMPTADPETRPAEDLSFDGLDIPVYHIDERDTENGTSIDIPGALRCHIIAYSGDHCGGNIGNPISIPTNNQGACVGVGPSSGAQRNSYRISEACPPIKMYFYISNGCSGSRPHSKTIGAGCHDINTGGRVNSMCVVRA